MNHIIPKNDSREWRVFYTASRSEKLCENRISQLEITVLLPRYRELRIWSDRKKIVSVPLFKNYIFAEVNEEERRQVLRVKGIIRCVSMHAEPVKMTPREMENLRMSQILAENLSTIGWNAIPAKGQIVTIKEGPFAGLEGEVLNMGGQQNVILRISTLRQLVRINLPLDMLRVNSTSQGFLFR